MFGAPFSFQVLVWILRYAAILGALWSMRTHLFDQRSCPDAELD